jgi:2-oxoglutarate dehydrogenase E1 component
MTPKSMLRAPTSTIEELTSGHFRMLIDDPMFDRAGKSAADRSKVKKVLWCSGKIYHELAARREALAVKDIAIVRVEQFYPFDLAEARRIAALYPNAARRAGGHVWVQEEPRNKGGFLFISDIFRTDKELAIELEYIGRPAMAASALGSKKADKKQQEAVLTGAIGALPASAADPKHGSNGTHDAKPAGSTPKTVNS